MKKSKFKGTLRNFVVVIIGISVAACSDAAGAFHKPENVRVSKSAGEVVLSWDAVSGASTYKVERKDANTDDSTYEERAYTDHTSYSEVYTLGAVFNKVFRVVSMKLNKTPLPSDPVPVSITN